MASARGGRRGGLVFDVVQRLLQVIALYAPGAQSTRVWLHRMRGVTIGYGVFIGMDALIETSSPELIEIGDRLLAAVFPGRDAARIDQLRRIPLRRAEQPGDEPFHSLRFAIANRFQ